MTLGVKNRYEVASWPTAGVYSLDRDSVTRILFRFELSFGGEKPFEFKRERLQIGVRRLAICALLTS